MLRVLHVEDDELLSRSVRRVLELDGVRVTSALNLQEGRWALHRGHFDAAFIDLRLTPDPADRSGLDLVRYAWASGVAQTWVTTAYRDADIDALCRGAGARGILPKDSSDEGLVAGMRARLAAHEPAKTAAPVQDDFAMLIGESAAMRDLRWQIRRAARSEEPVLITGETGSGKNLVVRALHELTSEGPLEARNVGGFPESLFESEVFGHERGAFTGAVSARVGALEAAGTGTLFLDEIGDLSMALQPRLLDVIQSRRFRRVGGTRDLPFKARFVAATHVDLEAAIVAGRFRRDLFHRLDVVRIHVAPLRERREDIPALVATFAAGLSRTVDQAAIDWLTARDYPGNVRDLASTMHRLLLEVDEHVTLDTVRAVFGSEAVDGRRGPMRRPVPARDPASKYSAALEALAKTGGNVSAAAALVNVHRNTLTRWRRASES